MQRNRNATLFQENMKTKSRYEKVDDTPVSLPLSFFEYPPYLSCSSPPPLPLSLRIKQFQLTQLEIAFWSGFYKNWAKNIEKECRCFWRFQ